MDRMGFGKPVSASVLDEEYRSGRWDHFFEESEQARHEAMFEFILAQCDLPRLLDMGCGNGRLASMVLPKHVATYLGVDISAEGLRLAEKLELSHARFLRADFESWQPVETYDIITFSECLGYAKSPLHTAVAYSRHLAPGGALIISHYRWGNHEAIWQSLHKRFRFTNERVVTSSEGKVWDIKTLQLR